MQKGNTEEAIAAYQKAANVGNAEACYRLAIWTAQQANGNLSEEEFKQVLSWLKQAAQQEHPEACYCMGALMEKNHPEVACKYYEIAANRQYIPAMLKLALLYDKEDTLFEQLFWMDRLVWNGEHSPLKDLPRIHMLYAEKLKKEVIDVTLPAKKNCVGHRHPNTIALEEVERVFTGMGYEVVEGPEIEYDEYNFRKLNIPDGHPAKDEQDTFYINEEIVLRTQTSPVQVRTMEQGKLPIRMIAPGRVFRSDEVDATHSPSFHQIEGLVIDKNITFADLKGTLAEFAKELFGEDTKVKFRPHHFPFTEPSAEVDVSCFKCGGKGCRFCKGSGWIEILGCGMVHPKVLKMCNIDPEEYSGFAFGVGLERIALLKYEIDDMRLLYENDIRFLKQF